MKHTAIKICLTSGQLDSENSKQEQLILKYIKQKDPLGLSGIIKFYDRFTLNGHECTTFEYLKGGDIYKYINSTNTTLTIS
jgi:serine/threonine protein kinase